MPKTIHVVGSGTQLAVRIAEGTAALAPVMSTALGVGASVAAPCAGLVIFVTTALVEIQKVCDDWEFDSKQAESLPSEVNECARIITEKMFPAVVSATEENDDSVLETSFCRVATDFLQIVDKIQTSCEKWNDKKFHTKLFATNKYKKKIMELTEQLRNFKSDVLMAFETEMHSYTHAKLKVLEQNNECAHERLSDLVGKADAILIDVVHLGNDTQRITAAAVLLSLFLAFLLHYFLLGNASDDIKQHVTDKLDNFTVVSKPPDSTSLPESPILFGRQEELNMLNETLAVGGRMAALVGGAGMGKSHCASHFARQWLREDPAHRFVLWLEADTENIVRVSYLNALETLGVELPDANEKLTIRDIAGLVWDQLLSTSTQFEWMAVYNNVPEALSELEGPEAFVPLFFLAPLNDWGRGRILLTTRCASYGGRIKSLGSHYVTRISIEPLDESTAVTMLVDNLDSVVCTSESEMEAAKEIVELFGYLPLAIATANSQMVDALITVSEYLDDLKGGPESGVHDAVTLALTNALEYARNHGVGRVLDVAAFLSPDQLTLELLDCNRTTARRLCKLSLLRHDGGDVYSIHRMHQAAARDGISPSTAINVINSALERFDANNSDTWKYGISLIPHLDSLIEHIETMKKNGSIPVEFDNLEYATLLVSAGSILHLTVNDYSGAMVKYKESLKMMHHVFGPDAQNDDLAITLHNLGLLERDLSNYGKAREYYEVSLKMIHHVHGPDAQNTGLASLLNNLGILESELDNYDKAREYYKESLEMKQQVYDTDAQNADLAMTLNNLGELERKLCNYDKAREYYEKSLEMKQQAYGPDAQNADLAWTLNNLGALEYELGNYDKARDYYKESLEMKQQVYGADAQNADFAGTLNNLGLLERELGNYDEARANFEGALSMMLSIVGDNVPNHPQVERIRKNLNDLVVLEAQQG